VSYFAQTAAPNARTIRASKTQRRMRRLVHAPAFFETCHSFLRLNWQPAMLAHEFIVEADAFRTDDAR
jgi:hypothetical protein